MSGNSGVDFDPKNIEMVIRLEATHRKLLYDKIVKCKMSRVRNIPRVQHNLHCKHGLPHLSCKTQTVHLCCIKVQLVQALHTTDLFF